MSEDVSGYSVKDFLAIHTKALERIERKVDEGALRQAEAIGKLDTRVTVIEQRENLEPRLRVLEAANNETQGSRRWWDGFWARAVGLGTLFGALWWLPAVLHHHG